MMMRLSGFPRIFRTYPSEGFRSETAGGGRILEASGETVRGRRLYRELACLRQPSP